MRGGGLPTTALLTALLIGFGALTTTPAAAAQAVAETEPTSITVPVPAPGNVTTWAMPAVNPYADVVDVTVEAAVLGTTDALPLTFSLFDPVLGGFVVEDVVIGSALAPIPVGRLEAGESRDLIAHLHLSADAGNEFQGASQSMLFTQSFATVGATDPAETERPGGSVPSWLAETGVGALLILVVAKLLVVIGIIVFASRRRRRDDAEASTSIVATAD